MAIATPTRTQSETQPSERYEALVLDFLAHLEFERGLSRNTLAAYRTDLLQFGRFLGEKGKDATTAEASDLSDFLADLAQGDGNGRSPCSTATVNRKAACLRSFYRHLRREETIEDDPASHLETPRRGKKLPEVLSYAEVQRLLAQPRGDDQVAVRDRALLELMYASGLRASETISLGLDDVDLEQGIVRARGKGSKERLVPIGGKAVAAVRVYLRSARPKLVRSPPASASRRAAVLGEEVADRVLRPGDVVVVRTQDEPRGESSARGSNGGDGGFDGLGLGQEVTRHHGDVGGRERREEGGLAPIDADHVQVG